MYKKKLHSKAMPYFLQPKDRGNKIPFYCSSFIVSVMVEFDEYSLGKLLIPDTKYIYDAVHFKRH